MAKSIQTQLSEVELEKLKKAAGDEGRSVSNYVSRLIRVDLAKKAA